MSQQPIREIHHHHYHNGGGPTQGFEGQQQQGLSNTSGLQSSGNAGAYDSNTIPQSQGQGTGGYQQGGYQQGGLEQGSGLGGNQSLGAGAGSAGLTHGSQGVQSQGYDNAATAGDPLHSGAQSGTGAPGQAYTQQGLDEGNRGFPSHSQGQGQHHLGRDAAAGGLVGGEGAHLANKHAQHEQRTDYGSNDNNSSSKVGDKVKGFFGMNDPSKGRDPSQNQHPATATSGQEHHVGRDAAVGAGVGAGGAHLANKHHHGQGSSLEDQRVSVPEGHSAAPGGDYTQQQQHHYGRDAAIGAGAAGVGAEGIHHHNQHHGHHTGAAGTQGQHFGSQQQPSSAQQGYGSSQTQGPPGYNDTTTTSHGGHHSHVGRDAALGAGAGAGATHLLHKHEQGQHQQGYANDPADAQLHGHHGQHHTGRNAALGAAAGGEGAHLANRHHEHQGVTGANQGREPYAGEQTSHGHHGHHGARDAAVGAGVAGEGAHLANKHHDKHAAGTTGTTADHHSKHHTGRDAALGAGAGAGAAHLEKKHHDKHPAQAELDRQDQLHADQLKHGGVAGKDGQKATYPGSAGAAGAGTAATGAEETGKKPSAASKLAGSIEVAVGKISGDKIMVEEGKARKSGMPLHKSGSLSSKDNNDNMLPHREGGLAENYERDTGENFTGKGTGLERDVQRMNVGGTGSQDQTRRV